MKQWITNGRPVLCSLILLAFFLPAYKNYSAFNFVPLAVNETSIGSGVTSTDVLMLLIPLLLVPVVAILFFILYAYRISIKPVYLAMPLVFASFFLLLFFRGQGSSGSVLTVKELGAGFYLGAIAVALLPFTKDAKKKSRRRRRKIQPEITADTSSL